MPISETVRQQRLDCLNTYWKSLMSGDIRTFETLLAPDAVIHYPGSHSLSGDYRTTKDITGLYTKLTGFVQEGTFKGELLDVIMGEVYTAAVIKYDINLPGKTIPGRAVGLFIIENGKIKEYWLHEWDQMMINRVFWANSLFKPLLPIIKKLRPARTQSGGTGVGAST